MMGFAGMERDTVTGLNLAVNRVQNPGTGRWDSQDPMGLRGGNPELYGYAANDPSDLIDSSGLKFGRPGVETGQLSEDDLTGQLAKRLGISGKSLNGIKASAVWQCVARSQTAVHVRFWDTGVKYGGTTRTNKDGSITVVVDPTRFISKFANRRRTPRDLLDALLHELIHAALRLGCNLGSVNDQPHDPNYPKGYKGGSDLNNDGQNYIRNLLPLLPEELPGNPSDPDKYDPPEPKLGDPPVGKT